MITVVNSKDVDNNLTFRKLGGTSSAPGGLLVVLGSGSVSVSEDMNNVGRCLFGLAADGHCGRLHFGASELLFGVKLLGRSHHGTLVHFTGDLGSVTTRRRGVFRKVGVHCFNPVGKRSIGGVTHILQSVGSVRKPGVLRLRAMGKGKFRPTRGGPSV